MSALAVERKPNREAPIAEPEESTEDAQFIDRPVLP
jgi:hypothetical protein